MINEQDLREALEYLTPPKGYESKHLGVVLTIVRAVLEAKVVEKKECITHKANRDIFCYMCRTNRNENEIIDAMRLVIAKRYVDREKLPTVGNIVDLIISKHIYIDGQCDTDKFAVVPIKELAAALSERLGGGKQ